MVIGRLIYRTRKSKVVHGQLPWLHRYGGGFVRTWTQAKPGNNYLSTDARGKSRKKVRRGGEWVREENFMKSFISGLQLRACSVRGKAVYLPEEDSRVMGKDKEFVGGKMEKRRPEREGILLPASGEE